MSYNYFRGMTKMEAVDYLVANGYIGSSREYEELMSYDKEYLLDVCYDISADYVYDAE